MCRELQAQVDAAAKCVALEDAFGSEKPLRYVFMFMPRASYCTQLGLAASHAASALLSDHLIV